MTLDLIWPLAIALLVAFAFGVWFGIWLLKKVWLEPGFKQGFIMDGHDAYSITRKRRN